MKKHLFRNAVQVTAFLVFLELFLRVGSFGYDRYLEWGHQSKMKAEHDYQVLALGESMTMAGGESSYPNVLEQALNRKQPERRFNVINKGISSYTTLDVLQELDENLKTYNPDVVVLMIGLCDAIYNELVPETAWTRLRFLVLERSWTFRLAWELTKKTAVSGKDLAARTRAMGRGRIAGEGEEVAQKSDSRAVPDSALTPASASAPTAPAQTTPELTEPEPIEAVVPLPANSSPEGQKEMAATEKLIDYQKSPTEFHPFTIRNYNDIVDKILARGKILIVMQYPRQDIEPLKRMIRQRDQVIFLENRESFEAALATGDYKTYFSDRWAGNNFGHFNHEGSILIADPLSDLILDALK